MSHIAIDARIINSSTGRYVERLIHYLEKIDHDNTYTILVPTKDKDFYTPNNPNFSIQTVDFKNYSFAEQTGFLKFLNSLNADLVHFCMPQQPILYTGAHVTTFHDLTLLNTYNSDKNWFVFHAKQLVGRFVFHRVLSTSTRILTPTWTVKRELEAFHKGIEDKVVVTYEAADKLQAGKVTPYDTPYKKFLLYVGQQSDYKNIRRLGDAHQQLLETHPDLGLILAGRINKSAQMTKDYFEKKGYKNIHFTGFVEDDQRDWLFENCAAYVFPSLMEGFGLPPLEAMQYDAPVVSSNASCMPEVLGEAAHYFTPTEASDIARAVNDVLTDDVLRNSLIEKGKIQRGKYSWHKMAQETLDQYTAALSRK
jgi:glycosyltransferase involved in cell wall biosynthesis